MNKLIPIATLATLVLTSCIDHTPSAQKPVISAASCPSAAVNVMQISYNESLGKYKVFHDAAKANGIPNPLSIEDLQMAQIERPKDAKSDIAKLAFTSENGNCNPVLQMTQGYKIGLVSENTPSSSNNNNNNTGSSGGSGGSSWAPFLMGALVGNAVSNAMQPRYSAPAYYLPPPASSGNGGLVTGGVSGKTPEEMTKKYESQYKQPAKKGFFSKSSGTAANPDSQTKKSGFFSKKKEHAEQQQKPKKTGFFSGGSKQKR
ncbi:hypothetical protein [Silvanigrella aquatica]|uniref:Lipoprotein n=1 Tax=Silvanigrella aquatica TaxID=1915309 RepID=A0A1L4CZG8_9BACT|nr:hypothetical protein [Silvanigrella aquatica]APJ03338.1 hypothetical protein AXG55_05230 [Silvanigrella aquatica]